MKFQRLIGWMLGMLTLVFFLHSCKNKPDVTPIFAALDADQTGLKFSNTLKPTNEFNLFNYMYYYNGAGVGAGDFNNDGLTDLFFAANQTNNKIFINRGNLKFEDITDKSSIPQDGAWSTGVSVIDINNDGLLDIYVCRVGNYQILKSRNQLLVCQGINSEGIPTYRDEAASYGIDYSGFSTQAAFFDQDMDGDLDMFLLNHSVHENGVYRPRQEFLGVVHSVSGARMFRNDGKKFTDITAASGINSSVIGYGLGVAVADINLDGFPDLYIGNDFHENDYLYINDGKGAFKEEITSRMGHTSRFTMGVDIADITNDGHSEIISMDMLSDDPYILKRSLGEDDYDIFNLKISYGYQHQYSRNNLQLNRSNGVFSEVAQYAGLAATDWSWAPLFLDFDNDGWKDLFISNGIPKRMNDIDYINFVSNEEMQKRLAPGSNAENNLEMIEKFPRIKIKNKFFSNSGSLQFDDRGAEINDAPETYSNGAVYADFDNDGDLDIVVNNIDDPAVLYENLSSSDRPEEAKSEGSLADAASNAFVNISLTGDSANKRAIGAKIIVYAGKQLRLYEKFPVHGFQSAMEIPLHIGLGQTKPDSAILVWPDNSYEPLTISGQETNLRKSYRKGLGKFDYSRLKNRSQIATDITQESGLISRHEENIFAEFNREALLPQMLSTEGPALAVGDMNGDGREDVFIGGARGIKSALWLQTSDEQFTRSAQAALDNDSLFEDVAACWADVNNDLKPDLIVASGGNEFFGQSKNLLPRLYINTGSGLIREKEAFTDLFVTASVIAAADFNADGYIDLFLGGRAKPMEYGTVPRSFLLMNKGKGKFSDVSADANKDLALAGFVTDAQWTDLDNDGDMDLLVAQQWGPLVAYLNEGKTKFSKIILAPDKGWWNCILPVDVDQDGDMDLLAGNLGLNSKLKATDERPVSMYYYDFDDNGRNEQLLTYFLGNREIPFASIAELSKQMPFIKKKFLYAGDFAKASLTEIIGEKPLADAAKFTADYFSSVVLLNDGKMNFSLKPLPWAAQLMPIRDAAIVNANNDSLPDLLIAGNYFDSNTELGRFDADIGTVLINEGKGGFVATNLNLPLAHRSQARHVGSIRTTGDHQRFIFANNNDTARLIRIDLPGFEK